MRRFLVKLFFISFPILVIGVLMEILLRNTPNDYLFKKHYLDKNSSAIETLILGSSHSFYGFNPTYFAWNTFNASHISQSLDYDFEILKKYQSEFKSIKAVVLPISYFTLFGNLETGIEPWRVKNYVLYYDIKTAKSIVDYSEVLSNRININFKRLFSYYLLGESPITCSVLGWGTNYHSSNARDLEETGKEAAQRHTVDDIGKSKYQALLMENTQILNQIVKWCEERNVKLFLIMPPAYETYRSELNQEQLLKTIEVMTDFAENNKNCFYLNYLDENRFTAKDYYDADHLSEIGAKEFSSIINKEISSSGVKQ